MKLGFISDLHIDFNREHDVKSALINEYRNCNLDMLLIAGDTSNSTKITLWFLNELKKAGLNVRAIYGNHDYYTLDEGFFADRAQLMNWPLKITDNFGLIADTGWYNYSWHKFGSIEQLKKGRTYGSGTKWPDHRFIEWPHPDGAEWFTQYSIDYMRTQNEVLNHCGIKNKIIMTHMVPHYELLSQDHEFVYTNPFFGSEDLSQFIKEVNPKICAFGHTHSPKDKMIGDTLYICSPLGYNFEWGSRTVEQRMEVMLSIVEI